MKHKRLLDLLESWQGYLGSIFSKSACPEAAARASHVEIITPRLRLREMHRSDLSSIDRIIKKPGFGYFTFDGTTESVHRFIGKCIDTQKPDPASGRRSNIMLAVERKKDGVFIGFTSLETVTYEDGSVAVEPNFFIDPEHQSNGYGREAVANMMKFAFDRLGLNRLNVTVEESNGASLRVFSALGCMDTGRLASFNTMQGRKTYKVLTIDSETFREKRKLDPRPLFLDPAANDNGMRPR